MMRFTKRFYRGGRGEKRAEIAEKAKTDGTLKFRLRAEKNSNTHAI